MKKTITPDPRVQAESSGPILKWRCFGAFFLFCFGLNTIAEAQSKIWDKTIGTNNAENLIATTPTQDGGSLLAGSVLVDDYDVNYEKEIVKLGADGKKIWSKRLDDPTFNLAVVQEIAEGGYLLGGSTYTTKWQDFQVRKLKNDGTLLWVKTYGRKYADDLKIIRQTKDGGFILGGSSQTSKDSNGNAVNDYWIVKLDANGNKLWEKAYGGSGNDLLESVEQTQDGGYILGGSSYSGVSGNKTEPNKAKADAFGNISSDYWVIKVKADGTPVWDKTYGGTDYELFTSVKQTPDGGYILGGNSHSGKSGDKTITKPGPWLVKLNAAGNKMWDKTYGEWKFTNVNWQNDNLRSLELTQEGNYLLGLNSSAAIGGLKSEAGRGYSDYWIIMLRADGTKIWDKTIGGSYEDYLRHAYPTKDGNYLLAGTSSSGVSYEKSEPAYRYKYYTSGLADDDYWLVKLDNNIRQNQTLTFEAIKSQPYTKLPLALQAQASSGLPVTYLVASGPATVKGNKLTLTGTGKVIIKARQTGNATYNLVETAQSFEVTLASKHQDLSYGGGQSETLTSLLATPDGGYLAGGTSNSEATGTKTQGGKGKYDYWVVKTDNTGKKVWDKAYGGNQSDRLTTMVATPDGGYLLGGTSTTGISGDKSQATKGKEDYWLVKINAQGTKQWDKSYGGPEKDSLATIIATPRGYLLGGSSASGVTTDKSQAAKGAVDYWIMEIDANGNKIWDKTYGGSGNDHLAALLATPDGYLVGGSSASGISGDKTQTKRGAKDYWIVRIKKDGTKLWEKTYGGLANHSYSFGGGMSLLQGLAPSPDGDFLLAGTSNAFKGGERSEGRSGEESETLTFHVNPDYWVVKIDGQGTKVWDKFYGGLEYHWDPYRGSSFLSDIVALPEGGYVLGGTTDGYGGDISESVRGGYDYWLVKIDDQGQNIGSKIIGGTEDDHLSALVLAANGSYLLGGTSASNMGADKSTNSQGETDFWVVNMSDESRPNASTWNMRYGGNNTDNFTSIIKTLDGGYLAGGYTNSSLSGDKSQNSQGKNDYWIVKTDKNGKKEWDKTYGGTQDDYLNSVIQTQDGGYLLAGSTFSGQTGDKSQISRGGRDYWIVKTDAQGNKLWDKRYGGTGSDELKKVMQLASGRYILAGSSNSPQSGDKSQMGKGNQDYWVLKINPDGQKVWDRTYGGNAEDVLEDFALAQDGNFLLGGSSTSGANGDRTQGSRGMSDYWVVRIGGNGEKIWDQRYGGAREDKLTTLGITLAGNVYLAGTSTSQNSGDKTQTSQGGSDFWFLEINNSGAKLWDASYGGSQNEELRAVNLTPDGYLLAGTSSSNVSGDKTQPSQGKTDYWVVKIAPEGSYQWDQRQGSSGAEELRATLVTPDGGYLLAGRSNAGVSGDRTQPTQGGTDYWLVKIAPPATNSLVVARNATLAKAPVSSLTTFLAYPNPFQERVQVSLTLPESQKALVRVLDSQGNEITTLFNEEAQAHKTYQLEWQAGKQASGLYLIQLQTPTLRSMQKVLRSR